MHAIGLKSNLWQRWMCIAKIQRKGVKKNMKILLASDLKEGNPVIDGLYHHLLKYADIQASVKYFWNTDTDMSPDIVHIQWPEKLFGWQPIDKKDLKKLINQLEFWKSIGSKIVVTRHNVFPHTLNKLYIEAYRIIYSYSDAVIHYSQASIDNFHTIYDPEEVHPVHKMIYHPMYSDIRNDSNKKSARNYLGIPDDKKVILIFGMVRDDKERQFALGVFTGLDIEDKLLLAPKWYGPVSKHTPVKWLFSRLKIFLDRPGKEFNLSQNFVPEDKIQMYMNASDIVFIPRFEVLNSGVLLLAYSFNKIVVGPSAGSIGEISTLSGNPSFEVANISDAILKIKEGLKLSEKEVNNYSFVKKNMNWEIVIDEHIQLYKKVIVD